MKKKVMAAATLGILGSLSPAGDALACGDKFLVIGRVARRVEKAKHPAAVLLAVRPDARGASAARAMKLEATLKLAGHSVAKAPEGAPLAQALAAGTYDFVLVDLESAGAAALAAASARSRPGVIALAVDAPPAARKAAEAEYAVVVAAPSRNVAYLGAIDAATARRRTLASR